MTRNVALAQENGLVTSRRHESDARIRPVTITEQGGEALAAAFADWCVVQSSLIHAIGSDAADGLRRLAGRTTGKPSPKARAGRSKAQR